MARKKELSERTRLEQEAGRRQVTRHALSAHLAREADKIRNRYKHTFCHIYSNGETKDWYVEILVQPHIVGMGVGKAPIVFQRKEPAHEFPSDFLITQLMLVTE